MSTLLTRLHLESSFISLPPRYNPLKLLNLHGANKELRRRRITQSGSFSVALRSIPPPTAVFYLMADTRSRAMSIKEEFNDEQRIIVPKEEENINIPARIGYERLEIDACYPRINKVYGYYNVKKWMEACPPARRRELLECLSKEADLRTQDPIRGAGGRFMDLQAAIAPNEADRAHREAMATLAKWEARIAYLKEVEKFTRFEESVPCLFCLYRLGKGRNQCGPNCMFRHAVVGNISSTGDYYATIRVYGYGLIKKWTEQCPKERRGELLFCLSKEGSMRFDDPVRGIAGKIIEYEAAAMTTTRMQQLKMEEEEEPEESKEP